MMPGPVAFTAYSELPPNDGYLSGSRDSRNQLEGLKELIVWRS